ncbi:ATP-binding protein [uncultured Jannaschia sp.]|uniref:ATP-binding protein n=1 Tax=uncultured Jannaschia sp. TaxID=293347 RepID=UPI002601F871|nr:ATP-binding protein [uncultured Jannaschia sp.]
MAQAMAASPPITTRSTRIAGTPNAVGEAMTAFARLFELGWLPEARRADVELVVAEVLNNIVEHALAGREDAWIELAVTAEGGRVFVMTADDGCPLPSPLLAIAELPAQDPQTGDLPEGGFGWFIIHALTEDMTYERADGLNRLHFSFVI